MSVETLRAELLAMTEEPLASELEAPSEGDPRRPTPETLAERHDVPVETVYETIDEVIAATLPLRNSTFYVKWCLERVLEPWPGWPARPASKSSSSSEGPSERSEGP